MAKKETSRIELFRKINEALLKHKAKKIMVFGSYARGEENKKSDIDIIVEFKDRKSLLDLVGIEQELSEKLGIKVDLLTEKSISPYILSKIKKDILVISK